MSGSESWEGWEKKAHGMQGQSCKGWEGWEKKVLGKLEQSCKGPCYTLSEKDLVEVLVSGAARHINCATAIALTHAQGDHSTYQSLLDELRD